MNAQATSPSQKQSDHYLEMVEAHLTSALTSYFNTSASSLSQPHWELLHTMVADATRGGKRLRALCVYAGYLLDRQETESFILPDAVATLGAAVEYYQASALVHDDVIDQSDLRRGQPTTHRVARHHASDLGLTDPENFGSTCAILVGDIAYGLAMELVSQASPDSAQASRLLTAFAKMTTRVAIGQYLDVLADSSPVTPDMKPQRALEVISYKTAGYSVLDPLCLGAILSGMSEERIQMLRQAVGTWGTAFQLRDDQLGAFATTSSAGKPQAHDIIQGKRTYLLATTMRMATTSETTTLRRLYEQTVRTPEECLRISTIMENSGARAEVDRTIDELYQQGRTQLAQLDFKNPGPLIALSERLLYRDH